MWFVLHSYSRVKPCGIKNGLFKKERFRDPRRHTVWCGGNDTTVTLVSSVIVRYSHVEHGTGYKSRLLFPVLDLAHVYRYYLVFYKYDTCTLPIVAVLWQKVMVSAN